MITEKQVTLDLDPFLKIVLGLGFGRESGEDDLVHAIRIPDHPGRVNRDFRGFFERIPGQDPGQDAKKLLHNSPEG